MIAIKDSYASPLTAGDINPSHIALDFFRVALDGLRKKDDAELYDGNVATTVDNCAVGKLSRISHVELQSSSVRIDLPPQIREDIASTLWIGQNIMFEDGIDNEFQTHLGQLVMQYGPIMIDYLRERIMLPDFDIEIASETMRYLGDLYHVPSYGKRLHLLMESLAHPSAKVRDGAALGIAALDDPRAIPVLQDAIRQESIAELREDMRLVLEQLEETL